MYMTVKKAIYVAICTVIVAIAFVSLVDIQVIVNLWD